MDEAKYEGWWFERKEEAECRTALGADQALENWALKKQSIITIRSSGWWGKGKMDGREQANGETRGN